MTAVLHQTNADIDGKAKTDNKNSATGVTALTAKLVNKADSQSVIGHYSTLIDRRTKYIRPLVYLIDKNLLEPNISKISSEISGHKSRPDFESGISMMAVDTT